MKRNNPIYAKMFAAMATKTNEELINSLLVLRVSLFNLNDEQALTYSCIWEELEYRLGDKFDEKVEELDYSINEAA